VKENYSVSGYEYHDEGHSPSHDYLLPAVLGELKGLASALEEGDRRLFELGCGNGSVGHVLSKNGWQVSGIDASDEGIAHAQAAYPHLKLSQASAYDDLRSQFGTFPVVTSLEVVEHLYAPRDYTKTLFDLLEPGGTAIVSTPYHGYWKNLVLAISGKMDAHFTALWDHGHIKFWSEETLAKLLDEAGFENIRFERVGRIRPLAKSMIAIARKPDR